MKTINVIERKIKDTIKNTVVRFGYSISKIQATTISNKIVPKKIGKFKLLMREDHQLPVFLKHLPYYSKNLPRLAKELLQKYENLKMIDIGANVGDTVALVRSECFFPIYSIDGDPQFFSLLEENMKQFKEVKIFRQLLGEKDESVHAELKKSIETARLHHGETNEGGLLSVVSLDTFVERNKEIKHSKLLKIDTDGYDMKIIRGALGFIEEVRPVIFLEYDTVFFADQGDAGVPTLLMLENIGYDDIIFYDNLGKIIVSGSLSNHLFIKQMNNYIDPKLRTPFPYYDVAIFHKEDKDVAEKFIESEMVFFYNDNFYAK